MIKNEERQRILSAELEEYEKITSMTEEERAELHQWVSAGYSVHDNPSKVYNENGWPMDFLDVYREEEELRNATASMTYEEETEYLRQMYGFNRNERPVQHQPTYDELMKKAKQLFRGYLYFRFFLEEKGLLEEADAYVREFGDADPLMDMFEYDMEQGE